MSIQIKSPADSQDMVSTCTHIHWMWVDRSYKTPRNMMSYYFKTHCIDNLGYVQVSTGSIGYLQVSNGNMGTIGYLQVSTGSIGYLRISNGIYGCPMVAHGALVALA